MPPVPIDIGPRSLIFFFDESGDPKFRDPQHPLFTWAGCAMRGETYANVVRPEWLALRERVWPGRAEPLHAKSLRNLGRRPSGAALVTFFEAHPFLRIVVVGTSESEFHHGLDPLTCLGIVLRRHIIETAEHESLSHVALIFEDSTRDWQTVQEHVGPAVGDLVAKGLRVDFGFMRKSVCEPGMEIADVIAHTAGRHARREPAVDIAIDGDMNRIVSVLASEFSAERDHDEDVRLQEPDRLIDAVLPKRARNVIYVDVDTAWRSADGERVVMRSTGR